MKTKTLIFSLFFVTVLVFGIFTLNVNAYFGAEVASSDFDTFILSGAESGDNKNGVGYIGSGKPYNTAYALIFINDTTLRDAYLYGYFNDNVHLRIYYRSMGSSGLTYNWRIYRITSAWDASTVTWDTAPTYSSMLYNYTITKSVSWDAYEYCYLDIHDDFQAVMEEDVDYYGYMIYCYDINGVANWVNWEEEEVGVNDLRLVYGYDEDEDEGEDEGITVTGEFLTNWFMYAIFLVVIPIAMTAYISNLGQQASPSLMLVTFLGSETLMSAISLSIGLIDIWFMLVVIIVDVLLILGLMKGRG